MDPNELFYRILDRTGRSRRGYKKVRKGVQKRLLRHMRELGYERVEDYCAWTLADSDKRREFDRLSAVTISRFFRDRNLWPYLQDRILPELIDMKGPDPKIWSAGCANGEEPFSLSILLDEFERERGEPPITVELLATDISSQCLSRARAGVYESGSLKETPQDLITRHFLQIGADSYLIAQKHRLRVSFMEHDFLEDRFPAGCAIILARNNMFTYFSERIALDLLKRISNSLNAKGYLIIGSHETLPPGNGLFEQVNHQPMIYQKTG